MCFSGGNSVLSLMYLLTNAIYIYHVKYLL